MLKASGDKLKWNDIPEYRDFVLYWKISTSNISRKKIGDVAGNQMNDGYIMVQALNKRMLAHRVVWEMHNGSITNGMHIDHLNHIRNDNRIENLRLVSRTENNRNKSVKSKQNRCFRSYIKRWAISGFDRWRKKQDLHRKVLHTGSGYSSKEIRRISTMLPQLSWGI
ncbi:HNH endonuclease [Escherichia virus ECH1]